MNQNGHLEKIRQATEPLRQQIITHNLFESIRDLEDLHIFMHYHVFAVWDFMSLLKSLQNSLTATSIPWYPKGAGNTRFLINEMVTAGESDLDRSGNRSSHFELYLDAMRECGAGTAQIDQFIHELQRTGNFRAAFAASGTPGAVRDFVDFTFTTIRGGKDHLQSAMLAFGRENLIPDMFHARVQEIGASAPEKLSGLRYYLDRHARLHGDYHSHLALNMTAGLCGDNELFWAEAERVATEALQKRIRLWDGAYRQITVKVPL